MNEYLPIDHPQNPYKSVAVSASAGSGKTYQLSHRFLYLVAAGANPAEILTITFTRKATHEMRARIVEEACDLLSNSKRQQEFQRQLNYWYQASSSSHQWRQPRSAEETVQCIIEAPQQLKISTIDSVFYDWVRRFHLESFPQAQPQNPKQPEIVMAEATLQPLRESAWRKSLSLWYKSYINADQTVDIERFKTQAEKLQTFERKPKDLPLHGGAEWMPWLEDSSQCGQVLQAFFEQNSGPINELLKETKKEIDPSISKPLNDQDFGALINSGLFTKKNNELSKKIITKRIQEAHGDAVNSINSNYLAAFNVLKLHELDINAEEINKLRDYFEVEWRELKAREGIVEIADLLSGCEVLMKSPDVVATQYAISQRIHHLMIDEFQDTSKRQWEVFEPVIMEILSGENQLSERRQCPGTCFIVGDEKQSIFAFRESDPELLGTASERLLQADGCQLQLATNFRSSEHILDYVNVALDPLIADFPKHVAGRTSSQELINERWGKIWLQHTALPKGTLAPDRRLIEAEITASVIEQAISKEQNWMCIDSHSKKLRPLVASDCAVLYRDKNHNELIEQALTARGIRAIREENASPFFLHDLRDTVAMLKALVNPDDLLHLAASARSPWLGVDHQELIDSIQRYRSLERGENGQFLPEGAAKIWNQLRNIFAQKPLYAALKQAVVLTAADKRWASELSHHLGFEVLQRFDQLLEICLNLGSSGQCSAQSFMNQLELIAEQATIQKSTDAVQMMTIHKSKGLEFPFVAVTKLAEDWLKLDSNWMRQKLSGSALGSPKCLRYIGTKPQQPQEHGAFSSCIDEAELQQRAELNRLIYVALTRSRHHLALIGTNVCQDAEQQDLSQEPPTGYLADLASALHKFEPQPHTIQAYQGQLFDCNQASAAAPKTGTTHPSSAETASGPNLLNLTTPWLPKTESLLTVRPHSVSHDSQPLDHVAPLTQRPPIDQDLDGYYKEYGPAFGSCVHHLIEQTLNCQLMGETISRAQIDSLLRPAIGQFLEQTSQQSSDSLREWLGSTLESLWKFGPFTEMLANSEDIFPEWGFALKERQSMISGRIDLLCTSPGKIHIVDFKVSSHLPNQLRAQYSEQLALYEQAVRKIFGAELKIETVLLKIPELEWIYGFGA
jgi:ATP-dependent helicase/nuclease subunit A